MEQQNNNEKQQKGVTRVTIEQLRKMNKQVLNFRRVHRIKEQQSQISASKVILNA